MEEYVERRASAQPKNVRRLTAVRVNRNSAVHVSRDTYARETRRAPQPPRHDASYFNLNNTETPTAEPFTRLGGLQLEVGAQLVGVEARVCRSSFGVLVALRTPATRSSNRELGACPLSWPRRPPIRSAGFSKRARSGRAANPWVLATWKAATPTH